MIKTNVAMRDAFERDRRLTRGPVSLNERDALMEQRAKPVLDLHPSPDGTISRLVNTRIEADREARIGFIAKRLARQKTRAQEGFVRAR